MYFMHYLVLVLFDRKVVLVTIKINILLCRGHRIKKIYIKSLGAVKVNKFEE